MSKLFKRQGNYLHPLPTMEAPEVKNGDYFLAYGPIKRYEEHLKACETDKILIGEGLKKNNKRRANRGRRKRF